MKYVFLFLTLLFFNSGFSQYYKKTKTKRSWSAGTLFFYCGLNRSYYTGGNINFVGPGYDFTLNGIKAVDRPTKELKSYFSIHDFTKHQLNFRIGYNIKNNWAISVGYDHFKYVLVDNTQYSLSGYVKPGVDEVTNWSGTYNNEPVETKEETFHYENTNGLNYIRIELSRVDKWFSSKQGNFAISTLPGISCGGILSINDFTFAGRKDMETISMSGFGLSAHLGTRFEFFRHFFIQANASGGFMNQMRVDTRPNDYNSFAKQKFGFGAFEVVAGGLFYFKPKKGCDSCPQWSK
jgi:hypothetical protein